MSDTWAERHTLDPDADPSITDAYGNARPILEQMAADPEPDLGPTHEELEQGFEPEDAWHRWAQPEAG